MVFEPAALRIGVDLGGTKIEVAALDPEGGIHLRRRVPTPHDDYQGTLRAVTDLVRGLERAAGLDRPAATGICGPGSISPATGLVRNANSVWLNGQPLRQDLEALLDRPLRIANDADCLALSEARDGAAAGTDPVFAAILGTGVGGGVVVDGKLLRGANAIAGEWGHNPMPMDAGGGDGPVPDPCWCGRPGCIEAWLSGPALAADYRRHGGDAGLEVPAIAARASAGDALAEAALVRYETRLGHALATVINLLDPEVIVLGGGVSNLTRLYRRVPALWADRVFSDTHRTALLPARFGDSSGVRGAARLWPLAP